MDVGGGLLLGEEEAGGTLREEDQEEGGDLEKKKGKKILDCAYLVIRTARAIARNTSSTHT